MAGGFSRPAGSTSRTTAPQKSTYPSHSIHWLSQRAVASEVQAVALPKPSLPRRQQGVALADLHHDRCASLRLGEDIAEQAAASW